VGWGRRGGETFNPVAEKKRGEYPLPPQFYSPVLGGWLLCTVRLVGGVDIFENMVGLKCEPGGAGKCLS